MSAVGIRPGAQVALGMCSVCGAELARGEAHATTCEEDGFVERDGELSTLRANMLDAFDDLQTARRRRNARRLGAIQAKYEGLEKRCTAREAELRDKFRKGKE